jgi:hypothetical protein
VFGGKKKPPLLLPSAARMYFSEQTLITKKLLQVEAFLVTSKLL